MRNSPDRSVRSKVMLVVLATTVAALFVVAIALIVYESRTYERSTAEGLMTQAQILARADVHDETDILAAVRGTSNLLLLHTDLMGTVGTVAISPGVEQTAYGVFSDVVDIARAL